MPISTKIQKLITTSKEVLHDCALEDGALVAANTDKTYSPKEASDYRYVWIRDASYICVAADFLHLSIQENFFQWVNDRPEDFDRDKLLYSNYSTNGRIATMGKQFQADQMGTLLWAIFHHYKNNLKEAQKFKLLVDRLADGLCSCWDKDHFSVSTTDLWEVIERKTSTRLKNNFTYSLAACARGLLCANEITPNHLWKETAMQMIAQINEAYDKNKKYFLRNHGQISDENIDASMLGLVYPFEVCEPHDERIINTVAKMEEHIVEDGGVHRFQFDYFDSEGSAQEGGGAWPVLNCWMAIYWSLAGDKEKALRYFNWVVDKAPRFNNYLPEQYFSDNIRIGIYPLAWSHAMFIIAAHQLGYLT